MVPRVRAHDLWRVDPSRLEAAQDDATLIAIRDQERAGLGRLKIYEKLVSQSLQKQLFCSPY